MNENPRPRWVIALSFGIVIFLIIVGALGYQAGVSIWWVVYFVVYFAILGIGVILFRTSDAVRGVDEWTRDKWTLIFMIALALVLAFPLNFWW